MGWEDFTMFKKKGGGKKKGKASGGKKAESGRQRTSERRVLNALLKTLTSKRQLTPEDQDTVMRITMEKVLEAIQAQAITMYIIGDDDLIYFRYNYMSPSAWDNDPNLAPVFQKKQQELLGMTLKKGQGIVGKVIEAGKSYVSIDAHNDPNFYGEVDTETGFQTKSMITVPIEGDRVIGAIQAINKDSTSGVPFFTREDVSLLEEVAGYSAKVIQKVHDPEYELSDEEMAFYIAKLTKHPFIKLDQDFELNPKVIELIGEEVIIDLGILPFEKTGEKGVRVVMANPLDWQKKENFQMKTGLVVEEILVAPRDQIEAVIQSLGGPAPGQLGDVAGLVRDEYRAEGEAVDVGEGVDEESAPIVQLANRIIEDAYVQGSSDIHIEPMEKETLVRYRIDGLCQEKLRLPAKSHAALIARLKIMSQLDIAEKRLPQDGRIVFKHFTKTGIDMDLRVSMAPLNHGEKVCMRILDKTKSTLPLDKLGFSEKNLEVYRDIIKAPYGMVLHCGPTGSGKSMTLYSALGEVYNPSLNIQTAEDPIEYTLRGVNQMQMKREIGLTFASALRCFLRQDPDVILVGEIRDLETAEIAIEAALTGHLLFSTLHTNDAPTTVTRFSEMGIEPFMVSSTLLCVCAQRLMRRLCTKCKVGTKPGAEELRLLGHGEADRVKIYQKGGCSKCGGSGYKGRIGIHELMLVNDEIRDIINNKGTAEDVRAAAIRNGMITLHKDSMEKVLDGVTSMEEALRTVRPDEDAQE
ncbi:MAG: ATPase, T2SS/T4P/T4SS family [Planctomycetota bacterium]|jgi:type IV pilus assembly protein PilB